MKVNNIFSFQNNLHYIKFNVNKNFFRGDELSEYNILDSITFSGVKKDIFIPKEKLEELIEQGKSNREIAKIFGISQYTCKRIMDEYGLNSKYAEQKKYVKSISEEQLKELVKKGYNSKQIGEELGIRRDTVKKLLTKFNLVTKLSENRDNIKNITKEKILSLIEQNLKVNEICKILGIGRSTYNSLINKFNIETVNKLSLKNVSDISEKEFRQLVDSGIQVEDICKKLGIARTTYSTLLKKYNIRTPRLLNVEHVKTIQQEDLQTLVELGENEEQIASELGVSSSAIDNLLRKYHIVRPDGKVYKYNVPEFSKEELDDFIEMINNHVPIKEICKKFKINHYTYEILVKEHNIITPKQKKLNITKNITKEQLEKLIGQRKSVDEICKIFDISRRTYTNLLVRLGIKTRYQTRKENNLKK